MLGLQFRVKVSSLQLGLAGLMDGTTNSQAMW